MLIHWFIRFYLFRSSRLLVAIIWTPPTHLHAQNVESLAIHYTIFYTYWIFEAHLQSLLLFNIIVFAPIGGYPDNPGPNPSDPYGLSRHDCVVVDGFTDALCFAFRTDNSGPPTSVQVVLPSNSFHFYSMHLTWISLGIDIKLRPAVLPLLSSLGRFVYRLPLAGSSSTT